MDGGGFGGDNGLSSTCYATMPPIVCVMLLHSQEVRDVC